MKKNFKETENDKGITAQITDRELSLMAKEYAKNNPGDVSNCIKVPEFRDGDSKHHKPVLIRFKKK